ncbi:MAG: methionine--tRNA ligase [Phycisphaerae bacterium]|nr:methionine--tRNA ligase [Phycisphaerae bacterium]
MANRKFLVTGALPYSNGPIHVGHVAGAYLPLDIYVRYLRANGDDVRYICGSDDNGVAALKTAREEGVSVEELTARHNRSHRESFAGLGINFDIYGGTHQPGFTEIHTKISQEFFLKIHEKGYFTKRTTKQLYDAQVGQFLPDRFVKGTCPACNSRNAFGDQCEDCGRSMDALDLIDPQSMLSDSTPEVRETTHWFLRLDQLQHRLADWLRSKQDAQKCGATWRPVVLNQSLGRIEAEGLPERAMTRDLDWGIPVPLDDPDAKGKVLYVWFDAPIGYISFTAVDCERRGEGWEAYKDLWMDPQRKIVHFIGEDNIVFHAITFPAMLAATHDSDSIQGEAGEYQLPHCVVANSFLNIKFPGRPEEKISKSRGTAIWIEDYLKHFDPDPLRYYQTAIAPEQQRSAFDIEDFVNRNNSELLAVLGNFVNRTITFTHKYFDGKVPPAGAVTDLDRAQLDARLQAAGRVAEELEACHFKAAQREMMELARAGNVYFDTTAPFRTRKTDMEACGRAVNVCVQTVRTLTTLMAPFLPFSARKCLSILQLDESAIRWDTAGDELPDNHALGEAQYLVKKLEMADVVEILG